MPNSLLDTVVFPAGYMRTDRNECEVPCSKALVQVGEAHILFSDNSEETMLFLADDTGQIENFSGLLICDASGVSLEEALEEFAGLPLEEVVEELQRSITDLIESEARDRAAGRQTYREFSQALHNMVEEGEEDLG